MTMRMSKITSISVLWMLVWNCNRLSSPSLVVHSYLPLVARDYRRHGTTVLRSTKEDPVPVTPCTRICRYNANVYNGNVCIGCFRETFEIGAWETMTPVEKYYTLLDAADRLETVADGVTIDEQTTGTSSQELQRQAAYWKSIAYPTR